MFRRIPSISEHNYKGTITLVDRCDGPALRCPTPPWIITTRKYEDGPEVYKKYLACKHVDLGSKKTSFRGKGCAYISCICDPKELCDCGTIEFTDITLSGFPRAKVVKADILSSDDKTRLLNANSAKLKKRRL